MPLPGSKMLSADDAATPAFAIILLALLIWGTSSRLFTFGSHRKLPPGPPRNSFIQVFHGLPRISPWKDMSKWAIKSGTAMINKTRGLRDCAKVRFVGDVIYLKPFGKSVIILSSFKACKDLLDKRGAIYSDRPRLVMMSELCVYYSLLPIHTTEIFHILLLLGCRSRVSPPYHTVTDGGANVA